MKIKKNNTKTGKIKNVKQLKNKIDKYTENWPNL